MPLFRTPAIVLRTTPYGEADKIVTLYTLDFGKIKGIAKGAKRSRKRFGNTLEMGSYIRLTFFEKETSELVRLTDGDLIHPLPGLREDFRKLAWASYLIEMVSEMTAEKIKNKALFQLLIFFLNLVDREKLQEEILRIFEVRLLSHLGYQPQLQHCLRCPKDLSGERLFFSAQEGGVLCSACAGHLPGLVPISLGTIKTLLLAQTLPLEKIKRLSFSPQALRESKQVLSLFCGEYLRKELKSQKFLELNLPLPDPGKSSS